MALDEAVRRNPTQLEYPLEREGHLLLVSGGTQTNNRSYQMRWEANAYTNSPPWPIVSMSEKHTQQQGMKQIFDILLKMGIT